MSYALTPKQADCLAFVSQEINRTGVAPSFDEIMVEMGLASKSGVHRLIQGLIERGHIRMPMYGRRRIELTNAEVLPQVVGLSNDALARLKVQVEAELAARLAVAK